MCPAYVSNQPNSAAAMLLSKRRILPFFPASLPDESLASRITRFHIERGNATSRETYAELFSTSPFAMSNLSIPRIKTLAQRLPGDPHVNLEKLLCEGTLLPISRLFTAGTANGTSEDCGRRSAGESGSTRICLQCVKEDVSQFDTAYLHRSHQIPAVSACWKHGQILLERCPECGCPIESPKDLTISPWEGCCCGHHLELTELGTSDYVASSTEMDIARFASFVLAQIPEGIVAAALPRILRDRALEMGFRRGKTQVDRRSLQTAMESHYSPMLLAQLDRAYANGKTKRLLSYIGVTEAAIEAPLSRLLLLANYLFQDAGAFLERLTSIESGGGSTTSIEAPSGGLYSAIQVNRDTDGLGSLVERLALTAIAEDLSIKNLWRQHYGAMKRIAVAGSKEGVETLKKAIDRHRAKSAKKLRRSSAKVHPRDADWAEEIKKTASRLFSESGRPTRVSLASLVKNTEIRPATWPDAIFFPQTRAACTILQESQWHFYARRVLWAMARHHGESVARTVITEDSGLEHHRVTDVYNYLVSLAIVPVAPFAKQLEANGITCDWLGPCPGKTYQNVGRGYQKTGVRIAYTSPVFDGKV